MQGTKKVLLDLSTFMKKFSSTNTRSVGLLVNTSYSVIKAKTLSELTNEMKYSVWPTQIPFSSLNATKLLGAETCFP